MSLPRPEEVIAHRDPFLFVDEVTELVAGERARGRWTPRRGESFFEGHFPGLPTVPGVLMCEAIAQLGAVALLSDERYAGRLPLFGGLDRARFRRRARRAATNASGSPSSSVARSAASSRTTSVTASHSSRATLSTGMPRPWRHNSVHDRAA